MCEELNKEITNAEFIVYMKTGKSLLSCNKHVTSFQDMKLQQIRAFCEIANIPLIIDYN